MNEGFEFIIFLFLMAVVVLFTGVVMIDRYNRNAKREEEEEDNAGFVKI